MLTQDQIYEIENTTAGREKWERSVAAARRAALTLSASIHPDLLDQIDEPAAQMESLEEAIEKCQPNGWILIEGDWQAAGRQGFLPTLEYHLPDLSPDNANADKIKRRLLDEVRAVVAQYAYTFID